MAAFKQHILFSSLAGAGYAAALSSAGLAWPHAALAGLLCGGAGMLPDLDSDSGRPVRELFGVTAAVVPFLLLQRLIRSGIPPEHVVLIEIGVYLGIRFGAAWIFKHVTVHRGMFHSIPAAAIAAELAFLADNGAPLAARWALGGGVFLGYLSHLVLDEIYSIDARGLKVRLNKSAGSALKLMSAHAGATVLTWLIMASLTYLIGVEQGWLRPISMPVRAANLLHPACLDRP